jgi:hypothetical protein
MTKREHPQDPAQREAEAKAPDRKGSGAQPPTPTADTPPSGGPTTPGRPTEAGSRQQTQPDQVSQSGSSELDSKLSERTGGPAGAKPASAK